MELPCMIWEKAVPGGSGAQGRKVRTNLMGKDPGNISGLSLGMEGSSGKVTWERRAGVRELTET